MIIYDKTGNKVLDITVNDNSYRYRAVMGDNNLTLYYSLAEHVELSVGSYCDFQGERYTLMSPESFKMNHSRDFEYTVIFESEQAKAKMWKFRNPVDRRLKFSLTAKPREHLQMFVDNMNRRDTGWKIGECVDGTETLINYDHAYCFDALSQMADTFKTEYEISGKTVSLRKVEYDKNNPLPLSYGFGNGFKPGVGRSNYGDTPPIEILFVQGGTQNIDASKYGNSELLLPIGQSIRYDGVYFEDEEGFNASVARTYVVDDLGYSIRRGDKELSSKAEDSLDCSEIYPKRVGEVTKVEVVDEENNFYDIIDNTIPNTLNYEEYLIGGETMTIIFQSGMLAGREFEVKYYHDAEKGKAARRFEIVPQDIDGITMPGGVFVPQVGDTYAIFNVMLPDAYVRDDETKTGASWEMFRQGVKYLFDNEEQKFSFTGELDDIWSKKDWVNIGGKIKLGGYIEFSDKHFQKDGVLVRITGIKDYINNPYSPEIELSNTTVRVYLSTSLKQLESEEVLVEKYHKSALQFTKRRFRDAQETMSMLAGAMLDNFTNAISPITVQTMQMLVGDQSLQFHFVQSKDSPIVVKHNITYDNEAKQLNVPAGTIQHMTLGINTIEATRGNDEYHFWDIPAFTSARLDDGTKKYYLYAKVSKSASTQTGVFALSESALNFETDTYNLLVGVLNSEYDGERSFAQLYGFTEILPGCITTDSIISSDGTTYFDLLSGEIGGNIRIKAGSSGYANLTDKPNLSLYATTSELDILGDRITAQVSRIDEIKNTIDTAGWITTADGNELYASKSLENGNTLISYINQAAGSTTILSKKINLEGAVSFTSLTNSLQGTINEKANSSSLGSLAYKSQVAEDLLSADLSTLINGKADSSSLGELAYKDAVEAAQLGSTIIVGGYLNTDYIKVNRIDADGAKIGGFTIQSKILQWTEYGYASSQIARKLKMGMSEANTEGVIDILFTAETTGRFGVKAVGSNMGGAAIYASSNNATQKYPDSTHKWAGFFDGGLWAGEYWATSLTNNLKVGMNGAVRIDNSDTFLHFVRGICIGFSNARMYDQTNDQPNNAVRE